MSEHAPSVAMNEAAAAEAQSRSHTCEVVFNFTTGWLPAIAVVVKPVMAAFSTMWSGMPVIELARRASEA